MIKKINYLSPLLIVVIIAASFFNTSCNQHAPATEKTEIKRTVEEPAKPEFYLYRPDLEKAYGYSHAVKIGNVIKISGAVSMDSVGTLLAPGNLEQQMKNCYSDLEKILAHYGCTFDDVVVENIFTTNMQEFIKVCGYRAGLYKKHFPAGNWIGVKELALVGQLIEIDMEVHK
ncbi:MAG: RidA family protein [Chitinophagaceae bacterium]|nr:RidA family protein [Chitinophagaceae bacterium]